MGGVSDADDAELRERLRLQREIGGGDASHSQSMMPASIPAARSLQRRARRQTVRILPVLSTSEPAQIPGTPPLIAAAAGVVTTLQGIRCLKGGTTFSRAN